ncbi:cobalamin-binding protein [Thalassotalea sp. PLHSN55]|uniref:cobalamin-binding protein n=1 Tax=Thalassotalea sp. PLHSN55 TaxID=3435888 RepID=UPI003F83B316
MNKVFNSIVFTALLLVSQVASVHAGDNDSDEQKQNMRIIAMAPHIVEMLFDIGAGKQIVGAVEYSDFPEEALSIERVGGYHGVKMEKILALKPDLVIAWTTGNQQSDIEQMQRLGLNVVFSHPKNVADVAKEIRYFGELTAREEQAKKVAQHFEQKLQQIRTSQVGKSSTKVFYQLWPEPMMTINDDTWLSQLLGICQGDNVFGENPTQYPKVGIENVIVAQPEIIIIPDEKSKKVQPVVNWQQWPEIPAVKNNHFVHVNADLLHRFSTRLLSGVEDMCEKIDAHR